MKNSILFIICISIIIIGCGTDLLQDQEWSVNINDIEQGLRNRDDIPAIDNPRYKTLSEVDYMNDQDQVLVANVNGDIKIYPIKILVYHELINESNELISYSTLTGTSSMWRRIVDGVRLDFGVSEFTLNNNLIMYDQTTTSFWSQLLSRSISGTYINTVLPSINVLETHWATAKTAYPDAPVLSIDTGFARAYDVYPYGDYREERDFILPFNMDYLDNRLLTKEKVLGILGDSTAIIYSYDDLPESDIFLTEDIIEENNIFVVGHKNQNYIASFYSTPGVTYTPVENALPIVFNDNLGNQYDLMGRVLAGPDLGTTLDTPKAMTGYWFIFPAFYENIEIR